MPRVLPPTYLFISMVLMVLLHFGAPVWNPIAYPWNLLGVLPLALGIALNLVADAAFKKYRTTVKPFQESKSLITTGPFRMSRHPMYAGMVLMLAGIGILLGSLTPLVVVAVFGVLMELIFVRTEEKMLEEKFGAAWREYKKHVRRWI